MKCELSDIKLFKSVFDSVSHIIDEVGIIFDSEGMRLTALNKGNTTFVDLNLKSSLFNEYTCNSPVQLTIDTGEFMKILKRGKNDDIMIIDVDDYNLIITFQGDSTRVFRIRLIDEEYHPVTSPRIDFPTNIEIPLSVMVDALKDMSILAEQVCFTVDRNQLHISTEGGMGEAVVTFNHESSEGIGHSVRSCFNVNMLQDIFRVSKFEKSCYLSVGDDMPILVVFKLCSGNGELSFMLAPRLNEE